MSEAHLTDEQREVLRDRFELLRQIGRGGQGTTFLAHDRATGEEVVVKELDLRRTTSLKAFDLFEREARALESISHPAIPAYVDAFHLEHADGVLERFFLVQEYVDGDSLEALIEGGLRLDEAQARGFLAEMLHILSYLHELEAPVIHRDIKPSNIMRRTDGHLALIDFGAVQVVLPTGGGSTIVGTSGYMPLEQLMGRAVPATDLYALGATVVHLMSHRHPADLPVEGMRLKFEPFVNASAGLKAILDRMLAPHVEDRFVSAREALDALDALERSEAPADRPAVNIEFGRPAGEKQNFFSWWVHGASRQNVRPQTPRVDLSVPVERPAGTRSVVEAAAGRLRIELPRNTDELDMAVVMTLGSVGLPLFFVINGLVGGSAGVVIIGLFFLCGSSFVAYKGLARVLTKVRIEIEGDVLRMESERPGKTERRELALDAIRAVDIATSVTTSSNNRTYTRRYIRVDGTGHTLDFGDHLPVAEQQYLVDEINRAIAERTTA